MYKTLFTKPLFRYAILATLLLSSTALMAQRKMRQRDTLKYLFYPYPFKKQNTWGIGIVNTTMPLDITEEVRIRVPAIDVQWLRRVNDRWHLITRLNAQVLQNLISAGPRYNIALRKKYRFGAGVDAGYWMGFIKLQGINTQGHGFQLNPNVSVAYRFNKELYLTFRAEALTNFGVKTYAGGTKVASEYPVLSGSAYSLILEQPFSGNVNLSLGFRAIYTNFYWQTWTLFEGFDRNLLFPQFIVSVIL